MTVEADIHQALMDRVSTLPFPVAYVEKGGDPSGEFVMVRHMPNRNDRVYLRGQDPLRRQGILQLTLHSPLGQYEVVYRNRGGLIAGHFPRDMRLTAGETTIRVHKCDVEQGFRDGEYWLTPVSVYYQG